MIRWERNRRIPREVAAALEALRFREASTAALESLDQRAWARLLAFCDREHLTLALGERCRRSAMPESVGRHFEVRRERNAERFRRILGAYDEIAAALKNFIVLKGFTLAPEFVPDPRLRQQYDLDLYCPRESIDAARDAFDALGYEPLDRASGHPVDHLPVMIRKTGWQWKGDYFDPGIPVSVDVHFRLWDADTEKFDAPGWEEFWERRAVRTVEGRRVPALSPEDALGYQALHLIRHLLRGSARASSIYEMAWFLETHAGDSTYWTAWRDSHPAALRRIEAITFGVAEEWFGCRLGEAAEEAVAALPDQVRAWIECSAAAPVEGQFRPAKAELWLHLCLIESARDRWSVARRRLLPARLPGPVDSIHVPEAEMTWRLRLRRRAKYLAFLAARAVHHARALPAALAGGARWWARGLGTPYWTFFGASALCNLGLFVFFLLYNLYLLDRGYEESFLGLVASAMSAGSIAGTLPAALLARRVGLRRSLLACFALVPAVSLLRAIAVGKPALVALAFLGGAAVSMWYVLIAPAIARLAPESKRPLAFSLFFSSGIGLGVVGGLVGGRLPGWLSAAGEPVQAKQLALIAGCLVTGLAVLPAARLRFAEPPASEERRILPRTPTLARFLAAIGVWNLATGAFNPFFNAFFARHLHTPVEQIGLIFSGAQLAQVAALLLAPAALRWCGAIRGISAMQAAAGVALAALAFAPGGAFAVLAYTLYMVFQWMSEPGLYTILMSRVKPSEQGGASALNFLVIFSAQAAAAALAGLAIARYGYPAALASAACVAVTAGGLFRRLLAPRASSAPASLADTVPG